MEEENDMTKMMRTLALLITILGLVAIVLGGIFVGQGFVKNKMIVDRMKVEKVTLALDPNNPQASTTINNAADAQAAADLIATHRRAIAPTYQDLLGTGRFDPTNPKDLTYAQAMNLENYLYMAVMAFGLVQVVLGAGAFMVVTGLALLFTGLILMRLPLKTV
jgi:ABC-type antimicrobial peptide transport system permease subunit